MAVDAGDRVERFSGGRIDLTDKDEVERRRRQRRRHSTGGRIALYITALIAALTGAGPFIWSAITSFKADPDLYTQTNNPFIYNLPPTLDHWRLLFYGTEFLTFAWNTLWVGLVVVGITLLIGLPTAYALARLDMKWSGPLGIAIFFVYLIPPTLLFIPLTRVVGNFGLLNNTWSMVLIYPTITIPVSVWLLIGYLKGLPKDIEEQAMVDGYSRLGAFLHIVVPLTFPGIVAVIVFAFTLSAHEFIYALAFVSSTTEKTISIGVPTELIRGDVFYWQSLQAAVVVVALPIALVFNLLLQRFIAGFTMGAVKG
ncbi:MAG: carbohydrate ABC transporter permease [Actinomycetota bacterium]|nr:carbohydrate ABC transporter permease [Actinomycetota bacterium]